MKKYILIASMVFSFVLISATTVFGEEGKESKNESINLAEDAKSAILIERDTGAILFDKNSHDVLPPASMTKLMTLLLIMEEIDKGNLKKDEMVRVSERAASMGGSQIFLEAGEEMVVDDLLKGVAVASGNDASVALAERIAGSEEAFVGKMNEKVKELGLENTKFQNTTGLPAEDHYSTAYDMAMIAKELLKYEDITNYTSIYEDYLRKGTDDEFWLVNTNKLVRFYTGVDGLKTGYTSEAKYCLTATAKKDDMRVVAVVMGAETTKERNAIVSGMLDYAFSQYKTEKIFSKDDVVANLDLLKSEKRNVDVVVSESVSTIHNKGDVTDNITKEINLEENLSLPINKGDIVGLLTIKNGDEILSEVPLTVNEDVQNASYFTLLKRTVQEMAKYR
ncbi:D-alanyl-D-alanine carboxypeptidase family protein [Oceanobacillus bengalensis]|uniref:serine-type D-Ala-D-Ala carboxypeptidase n=1 Tax=Oceanobacillus bengalensis TaxID=1435466 RepID=A0A494Z0V4_9BACI|nr:D-alanyl-D-alanine carboxypeptidase family protein [Oceanobacillus bengalensis]RKQ16090.1 D-alanyl-D-alanine carboxypeptidase [Oceanobacillus bengalensis]